MALKALGKLRWVDGEDEFAGETTLTADGGLYLDFRKEDDELFRFEVLLPSELVDALIQAEVREREKLYQDYDALVNNVSRN